MLDDNALKERESVYSLVIDLSYLNVAILMRPGR